MPLEEGRKTWKDGEKFFENDKPPGSEYLTTYAYADSVLRDAGVSCATATFTGCTD
jgi:hypothetical protein